MRMTRLEDEGPGRVRIGVVDPRLAKALEVARAVRGAVEGRLAALLPAQRPRRPST
ncbi:hypothetical protein [Streptomyces scabiei]|uniref:hypothetical protein n=1 Tax=Streptomyces scabiei TaxID=1930 RepID=UPI00131AA5B3|nr:hypothetical protein [Streptomyces scabiei]